MSVNAPKRVMIVEDDPLISRLMRLTLRVDGFETCVAADGFDALAEFDRCHPDAIVLDIHMPVMDGRAFYRELRRRGAVTPVLIVSADDAAGDARELHAEGYLPKPFDPDDLVSRVNDLCCGAAYMERL